LIISCPGQHISHDHGDSFTELSEGIDFGWSDSEDGSITDDNLWGSGDEDDDTLVWDCVSSGHLATPATCTAVLSVSANSDTFVNASSEVLATPTKEITAFANEALASQVTTLDATSETDVGSEDDADKMASLVSVASVPPTHPLSTTLSPQPVVPADHYSHDVILLSRNDDEVNNSCFEELGDFPSSSPSVTDEAMLLSSYNMTSPVHHTGNSQCDVEMNDSVDQAEEFVDDEDFDWD